MTVIVSRSYAGAKDLQSMIDLLAARPADRVADYPRVADLRTALSVPVIRASTRVWVDDNGQLVGFAFLDAGDHLHFEIASQASDTDIESQIVLWGAERLQRTVHDATSGQQAQATELGVEFVIGALAQYARDDDAMMAFLKQKGYRENDARYLICQAKLERTLRIQARRVMLLALVGALSVISGLAMTFYAMYAGSLPLASMVVPVCITAFFVELVLFSRYQNTTKEALRCPHCGYLANRKGGEDSIFLPRFKASTYRTAQKRLSTRHKTYKAGLEWDTYAAFQVTDICKSCGQVRRTMHKERHMGSYREPEDYEALY